METSADKIKIVYCLSALHNAGGMERVVTNKANYLVRRGYEVTIITTDQKRRPAYFDLDPAIQCVDLGINYEDSKGKGLLYKLCTYPARQRLHRKRLKQELMQLRPDFAISLFDHDVSFLWQLKDKSHKFLEIHFSRFKRIQYGKKGIWGLINKYRSRLDLRHVKQYERFVVLTNEDRSYWGPLGNIAVIPNANTFQSKDQSTLTNKNVIAVGRFDQQKQFQDLIEAWALLGQKYSEWKLRIFGNGELKNYLQNQIDRLGLHHNVKLCDPVQDIEKEYLNSSIAAMTSRYEGLPMALLEAQSCGLPMVSYACKCGPRDIIESGRNGFLVPEGDVSAFAQRLQELMENEALRNYMGGEAKKMSYRFSEELVMQQWLNLFNNVTR